MLTEATPSSTFDFAAVQHRLAGSAYGVSLDNNAPVYLVIDSPNPTTTNDKIARFLNSNGISWSPIPDSTSPTTVPSVSVAGQGQSGGAEQSAGGAVPTVARAMGSNFAGGATTQQSQTNNIATNNFAADNSGQNVRPNMDNNQLPLPLIPLQAATKPSKPEQVLGDNDKQQLRDNTSPIRDIYVARRMTRRQADELRAEIAGSQDAPVRFYDQTTATNGPTTKPTDGPQGAKDDLMMMKAIAMATTAPSTQPAPAAAVATPIASGDILSVRTLNIELPPGVDSQQSLPVYGRQARRCANGGSDEDLRQSNRGREGPGAGAIRAW
jgi:hypothetical protein